MLLRVDARSEEPVFEQIAFAVKQAVARGELGAGERLPSVRELARELAVNPNTIVHAYELLAADGVITRRQGAGCFVSGQPSVLAAAERRRVLDELVGRAVTEAYHLGFSAADVRRAFDQALREVQLPRRERGIKP
jgi:GntR family transcriptional regulator